MNIVAYDPYEDARARFKHKTLVQDFMELQQETEAARNNLLALKQKKLTLQAEVRFLRRRHKFLLQNKSTTRQERVFMNTQPIRLRKSKKDKIHVVKQKTLHSLPSPEFDPILGNSLHGVNQQLVQRAISNQRVRVNGPTGSSLVGLRREDIFGTQEHVGQSQSQNRKPVIDLNQISRGEEELQDQHEPFESRSHGLIRNVKRKISWQDPVALTV